MKATTKAFTYIISCLLICTSACKEPNATAQTIKVNEDSIFSILDLVTQSEKLQELKGACPVDIYTGPEIEFKDFLEHCAVNQSQCLKSCLNGSANHCFGLAYSLESEDPKYYRPLYANACQLGLPLACTNVAASMWHFEPDIKQECTANSFALTCGLDDPWGCTMYATALHQGYGVSKNNTLALSMLQKSCKFGISDTACEYAKQTRKSIKAEFK